ncbi:hypothetical protein FUAX_34530 [Fulvitalea axinellae]|uniref:PpiC domain-containing protein n=2 Tax=Fulvitalea axinellae TaxID=1182444 RepID=A0AAU9DCX4_9BACT|nr:hypothetical protein FUAX_34530 [Fulvitalea axinellae]
MFSCGAPGSDEGEGAGKQGTKPAVLARVKDRTLILPDVANIGQQATDKADSAERVSRYIRNWVRKELMISEAESKMSFDQAEIKRKIQEYRYALMVYEFEKNYINRNLDTNVSEQEVEQYYKEHQDNFLLKQNIIRGYLVHLPDNAPKQKRFKKIFRSNKPDEVDELKEYCFSHASNYSLQDSLWINLEEALRHTPLASVPDKEALLKKNKVVEATEENGKFFLRIMEFRMSDDIAPIDRVRDQIRKIILNKRKIALISALEEQIYKRAEKNNEFEIFDIE